MSTLAAGEGISPSKLPFTGNGPRPKLQQQGRRAHQLCGRGAHGCRYTLSLKVRLSCLATRRGLLAKDSALGVECRCVSCSNLVRLPVFNSYPSTICAAPRASRFDTMEAIDDFDEQGDRLPSSLNAAQRHDASNGDNVAVHSVQLREGRLLQSTPKQRQFCKRCEKAALLCICHHVKTLVKNKTSIIILQHPEEKKHHLGTARIALLALQNVEMISIGEVDAQYSIRMREKVPGSKRFISGRGAKKAQEAMEEPRNNKSLPKCLEIQPAEFTSHSKQQPGSEHSPNQSSGKGTLREENAVTISSAHQQLVQCTTVPPWMNLQPDAGLLFPSEKALALRLAGSGLPSSADFVTTSQPTAESIIIDEEGKRVPSNSPSQLIVLDGTWSKAKRIFFENPWLHSLPHYRLPTVQNSRYGNLRREPKPGFLSTVESIVYALQLLEPETQDLESLLHVFDAMIEDQVRVAAEKGKARSQALV